MGLGQGVNGYDNPVILMISPTDQYLENVIILNTTENKTISSYYTVPTTKDSSNR